ncbi:MAG TPA: hypothetical protein VMU94_26320 [Streptosporangiaceae bacterium]|nr:hypothetical protein [Streptosporangiaceae bacterium]
MALRPFDDVWQSLTWADEEAEALKTEIDYFREPKPNSVEAESYPDDSGGEILFEPGTRPDLMLWTKQVGAAIGYMRAALNYASYQIALIDCPGEAHRVEFPVFSDPGLFQQQNRIGNFAQNRFGIIEAVQPYPGRTQELWWLHELARFHRHRLIRPVIDTPSQFQHVIRLIRGDLADITFETAGFEIRPDGKAVIGRWRNARPADTQVDVEPNLAVEVVVDDPLVRHETLPVLLFKMWQVTRKILTALEETFP